MIEIHTENKCNTLRQIYVKHEESTDFIVVKNWHGITKPDKYYWKSKCWSTSFKAFIIIAFEKTMNFNCITRLPTKHTLLYVSHKVHLLTFSYMSSI